MSLRAIRKRELRPYRKQQQQQQYQSRPQKYPEKFEHNTSKFSEVSRSKSYPDLRSQQFVALARQANRTISYSETDLTKLSKKFDNANLLSAKSEVCLKTISVHKTVHADMSQERGNNRNMSEIYRGDIINNNQQRRFSEQSFSAYSRASSMATPSEYVGRDFSENPCIRIPIVGYEVMEERARFTVYKLRVENPYSNNCWLVLRRYTDFVRFNNKLKQSFPLFNLQLPRKKIFGDNFNAVFLDNRVQGLQMFVNSIMANNDLRNCSIVREFFCLDEPPTYSESMEECRAIFEAQEETIAHLRMQLKQKDEHILSLQQKIQNGNLIKPEENLSNTNIKNPPRYCSNCSNILNE